MRYVVTPDALGVNTSQPASLAGRASLLLLVALLAAGCCPRPAPEIRYVPQRIEVPVAAPLPQPPVFERQPLPAESIPEDAVPGEVIRLLVATILQLQGEVRIRDEALDAYRRPPRSAPAPAPELPPR